MQPESAARQDAIERHFAADLRVVREGRKMSQYALAREMEDRGWPWRQQTIARIEAGQRMIRLGEAAELAAMLRMDVTLAGLAEGSEALPDLCVGCQDSPPKGFTCNTCGRSGS